MIVFLLIIHILLRFFSSQGIVINALGLQDIIYVLEVLVCCGLMTFCYSHSRDGQRAND